jgi:hypothetical protein
MPGPWILVLICCVLAAGSAHASLVLPTQERCQVAGPFATLVRAIEVAQAARDRGANPVTFRTDDGYFVRAC